MEFITEFSGKTIRVESFGSSNCIEIGNHDVVINRRETERLIEALQETLKEPVFYYKIKQNLMEVFEVMPGSAYLNLKNGKEIVLTDKYTNDLYQTQFTRAEFAKLVDKGSIYYGLFEEEEV